jgi:inositol-phosphate transport system permease protein
MVQRRYSKIAFFLLMLVISSPVIVGYVWITISSFAERTFGLVPVGSDGTVGGLTLSNWMFMFEDPHIWGLVGNTLLIAGGLTIGVVTVSAMGGYALSRIRFPGRRGVLSLTLILHAFPGITLLIALFFVLRWIAGVPVIGAGLPLIGGFGYNTIGGVLLVSLTLDLPLGLWLMKGFFDNVSWDIERSALIDGCSRFRTWWQIMLPQIRPGIAALSTFTFISGWNSFLLPYTFIPDQEASVISVYLNELIGDTSPVNYGQVAAVGLFQMIPVLVFFAFTQRYLLNIYSAGTKGTT